MIVHGDGERYVVSAVEGYSIHRGVSGRLTVTYSVLDSHYCYAAVQHFPALRASRAVRRRHAAERACDMLNAAERVGA